ncbi:hypothetical protein BDR04DRAFT_1087888 [Suillus decipiens]|nr:hypothetical protein BDR04DRAFT_1087888 [Suillus decipiens]
MHWVARVVCTSVRLPEMKVHARSEDCKDHDLENIQHVVVGVLGPGTSTAQL